MLRAEAINNQQLTAVDATRICCLCFVPSILRGDLALGRMMSWMIAMPLMITRPVQAIIINAPPRAMPTPVRRVYVELAKRSTATPTPTPAKCNRAVAMRKPKP